MFTENHNRWKKVIRKAKIVTDSVVTQHRGPWNVKTVGVESVSFAMIVRCFVFGQSQYSSYDENWTYCIFPLLNAGYIYKMFS